MEVSNILHTVLSFLTASAISDIQLEVVDLATPLQIGKERIARYRLSMTTFSNNLSNSCKIISLIKIAKFYSVRSSRNKFISILLWYW